MEIVIERRGVPHLSRLERAQALDHRFCLRILAHAQVSQHRAYHGAAIVRLRLERGKRCVAVICEVGRRVLEEHLIERCRVIRHQVSLFTLAEFLEGHKRAEDPQALGLAETWNAEQDRHDAARFIGVVVGCQRGITHRGIDLAGLCCPGPAEQADRAQAIALSLIHFGQTRERRCVLGDAPEDTEICFGGFVGLSHGL